MQREYREVHGTGRTTMIVRCTVLYSRRKVRPIRRHTKMLENNVAPARQCIPLRQRLVTAPGRTRTCDRRIRNPMLYPTELPALIRISVCGAECYITRPVAATDQEPARAVRRSVEGRCPRGEPI